MYEPPDNGNTVTHVRNWLPSGGTSADSKSLDFGEKAPEAGAEGSTDFIDKQEVKFLKMS